MDRVLVRLSGRVAGDVERKEFWRLDGRVAGEVEWKGVGEAEQRVWW